MMHYQTDEYAVRPTTEPVPPEVQAACDKANNRLRSTGTELVPYLATCSEGPDEWHVMLMDKDKGELCRHLRHTDLPGHTIMMLVKTMERYGKQCHEAGKVAAVNTLASHFKSIVGGS